MAPLSEILSMLGGQTFGKPSLPDIDLSGRTIIITGANTGLGLECAKHIASKRASHIILACRDTNKGQRALEMIYQQTKCKSHTTISVWPLDLTNCTSVLSFCERVRIELSRLDAFIANAGMEIQEYHEAEGLEIHLTVNVVSTFLSAIAVLPKLRETAKKHSLKTNLIFCGSMYHIFGPDAEFDKGLPQDRDMFTALSVSDPDKTDINWRYALSKLMVHQCFHQLVAALRKGEWSEVVVSVINPGWCGTELSRAKPHPIGERVWFSLIGWTAEQGSRMYLYALATGEKSHGKYLAESQVKTESQYVRSERGQRIAAKMWTDLLSRIGRIAPDVAKVVR